MKNLTLLWKDLTSGERNGVILWLSHGTERSAGVAILNDRFKGNIPTTECDPNGHYICQIVELNGSVYLIANVYGYNTKNENEILIIQLDRVLVTWLSRFPDALLLLGDISTIFWMVV